MQEAGKFCLKPHLFKCEEQEVVHVGGTAGVPARVGESRRDPVQALVLGGRLARECAPCADAAPHLVRERHYLRATASLQHGEGVNRAPNSGVYKNTKYRFLSSDMMATLLTKMRDPSAGYCSQVHGVQRV